MIKIAIFSDTHGRNAGMLRAVRRVSPDILVHLGDHIRDAAALREEFPLLPLYAVPGNCDFSGQPDTLVFSAGPVQVFAAHGHRYDVKRGTDALVAAARSAGAKLALCGHTHVPCFDPSSGVYLLNPGTAGTGNTPTFAVAEIGGDGRILCRILNI